MTLLNKLRRVIGRVIYWFWVAGDEAKTEAQLCFMRELKARQCRDTDAQNGRVQIRTMCPECLSVGAGSVENTADGTVQMLCHYCWHRSPWFKASGERSAAQVAIAAWSVRVAVAQARSEF